MDMKLELVMVPVTDVDRAKEFYEKVGFVVDHDQVVSDDVRFVQLTPPGSACSIAIGKGLTQLEPGSLDNMQMVIADADATHAELVERGIEVSEVDELELGAVRLLRRPRRQRLGAPAAARLVGGTPAARATRPEGQQTRQWSDLLFDNSSPQVDSRRSECRW